MLVPIVQENENTHKANFQGTVYFANNKEELNKIETTIANSGFYPYVTTKEELEELKSSKSKLEKVLNSLMSERLQRWLKLAEDRLKGKGVTMYMTGGNDDALEVTQLIKNSDFVVNPEDTVLDIDGMHEMASLGWANLTPWNCPRDISEEELAEKIEALIPHIKDMKNVIFNFHAPPVDSGLDFCPKLDTSVYPPKPIFKGGREVLFGAGSIAVRKAIEKYQPLLGLHGHIHESRGKVKIGRTLCVNPGSEYAECVLRGVLIILSDKKPKVDTCIFTSG